MSGLLSKLRTLLPFANKTNESVEPAMLLLVGLGNPGDQYKGNRHNVGFMAIDAIASMHNFGPWKTKFQGKISEGFITDANGERVKTLLLKPTTFYNDSGRSVGEAMNFFKISSENVMVFHDEIDLAPGRVRVKVGGGHSGNNGMRSIMAQASKDVRRTRLGVGHPGDKSLVQSHVLSDFAKSEVKWLDDMLDSCARSIHFLAANDDERFQAEVMRLAPAPKEDMSRRMNRSDT